LASRPSRTAGWKASNTPWPPAQSNNGKSVSRTSRGFSKAPRCATSLLSNANDGPLIAGRNWRPKLKLRSEFNPAPTDRILRIDSAKKSLATACEQLGFARFSHHDFRHFYATTCIESGVDIPTVSRWLGHSDGGALAMRVYGQLQVERRMTTGTTNAPNRINRLMYL